MSFPQIHLNVIIDLEGCRDTALLLTDLQRASGLDSQLVLDLLGKFTGVANGLTVLPCASDYPERKPLLRQVSACIDALAASIRTLDHRVRIALSSSHVSTDPTVQAVFRGLRAVLVLYQLHYHRASAIARQELFQGRPMEPLLDPLSAVNPQADTSLFPGSGRHLDRAKKVLRVLSSVDAIVDFLYESDLHERLDPALLAFSVNLVYQVVAMHREEQMQATLGLPPHLHSHSYLRTGSAVKTMASSSRAFTAPLRTSSSTSSTRPSPWRSMPEPSRQWKS